VPALHRDAGDAPFERRPDLGGRRVRVTTPCCLDASDAIIAFTVVVSGSI